METDNKYDQSFGRSEIEDEDTDSYEEQSINRRQDFLKALDNHITREPEDFGGGRSWI